MPAIVQRLIGQLMSRGKTKTQAFAIATATLRRAGNLKADGRTATAKGKTRGRMSPDARASDRKAKRSKGTTVSGKKTATRKSGKSKAKSRASRK